MQRSWLYGKPIRLHSNHHHHLSIAVIGHWDSRGYYFLPDDVPPELASVHYKLIRVASHLETLDSDIAKFSDQDRGSYRLLTERDPQSGERVVRFFCEGLPPQWSVAIGDIIQNLRNSLDALIFAIATNCAHATLSEEDARNIAFPICGRSTLNDARTEQLMPHVPAPVRDFVKSVQPHLHGSDFKTNVLWIVNRLAVVDKHRGIHLAAVQSRGIHLFAPEGTTAFEGWDRFTGGRGSIPLEHNEVIARYTLDGTEENAKIELPLKIVFKDADSVADFPLLGTLSLVGQFVTDEIVGPIVELYQAARQAP
jgi:hypothetical protein